MSTTTQHLLGVNLASAAFGSSKIPGTEGTDYIYPTHGEIDYYAAKGMDVIRLPFLWERLEPTENGPLSTTELSYIDDVVNYANSKGLSVILDPHNYGYGYGYEIGSSQTPNSAFANFWSQLAGHFADNPNVIFDLMNEPHDQTATQWLTAANAAISAIRDVGAVSQEILVPGTHWDSAWTWTTTDNASVIGTGVQDPSNNYAFEVHQYLDAFGSGTSSTVVSASADMSTTSHGTDISTTSHSVGMSKTSYSVDMSTTSHSVDMSTTTQHLLGVNLASAAFGSSKIPGTEGTDYIYPTHGEIDYYAAKGMDVIRLPFLWERLEPTENGPLSTTELSYIDDVVNYANSKGLSVILDPHNYGYGYGYEIGSSQTPNSAFANFWSQLAGHFADNPNVIFDLMNEPHDQTATQWLTAANAAISAIRDVGAVSQEILVPGTHWDSAWTWTTTDNASVIGTGVQDPSNNYAFEVHQYLDAFGSGTSSTVVSATIGVEQLTAITEWAEATGAKLFLGEFGVASDPTSLQALDNMLNYMQQNPSVWQGGTYWAGGPWWGNYMYSIEPHNGVDAPQMGILDQFVVDTAPPTLILTGEMFSNGQVTIQGTTGEARDAITIYDGSAVLGTTATAGDGTWTFTAPASNTVHPYTAAAIDPAGNVGYSSNEAILAGGSSEVTFIYNASADSTPASQDIIADFDAKSDVIDFTNIAGINSSRGLATFQGKLSDSGNLTLSPHSIAYMEVGTNTEVLVNTTNAIETVTTSNISAANMAIVLVGINLHLTANDFHHV